MEGMMYRCVKIVGILCYEPEAPPGVIFRYSIYSISKVELKGHLFIFNNYFIPRPG